MVRMGKKRTASAMGGDDRNKKNKKAANSRKKNKLDSLGDDAFDWGDEEEASPDEAEEEAAKPVDSSEDDDDDPNETAQEKRIRLAKEFLQKIQDEDAGDGSDDSENERERKGITGKKDLGRISERLQKKVQEATQLVYKNVAEELSSFEFDTNSYKLLRGHRLSVTAVAVSESEKYIYSAAKDGSIIRWDLTSGSEIKKMRYPTEQEEKKDSVPAAATKKKGRKVKDHDKEVLALAVSPDGKYVVSGGRDKLIRVWDGHNPKLLETFRGHREAITGLAFRLNSNTLLSTSNDRTVKHWNLDEMGYIETLYGHANEVNAVDMLLRERAVTCGRDRSVRMWKIRDESQLVFHGHTGSIDCVKMVNDDHYLSGAEDGSIALWHINRKKPSVLLPSAHGEGTSPWIASLGVLRRTDLFASGSSDGEIMLWKVDTEGRTIEQVSSIPVKGFANSLAFAKSGRFLVAGIGQEHRLGRWERIKEAKNGIAIIAMPDFNL